MPHEVPKFVHFKAYNNIALRALWNMIQSIVNKPYNELKNYIHTQSAKKFKFIHSLNLETKNF